MNRLTTTLAIAIGGWLISTPLALVANVFDFTLLPDSGIISGPAGSTIGWGYSITNNTTDWIQTENVSGGVFTNADPASPGFIFDFPAIAPLSTVSTAFTPVNTLACPAAPCGLFELIWSGAAPAGSSNTGSFILSADFYDGDPSLGGNDLGAAPDASASYEADVTTATTAVTPEPGYWLTILLILGVLVGLLIARKRAAVAALVALAALAPAARAADVYQVNTTTDIGGSVAQCTGSLPCSLRGAISLVNTLAQGTPGYTATIQVPSGTYSLSQTHFCGFGEENQIPLCMDANVNISIVGAGAASTIIDGNQMGPVFALNNILGNIQISGVTITNGCGRASNCGGVNPFTLTFFPGGGISNIGTLTVADCVITLNAGPGIYHAGPSYQQPGGTLSVFRTTFSNNSAGDGSAIQDLAGGAVTIVDSTFTGNFTNSCCGTIDDSTGGQGAPGMMTITGSTFTGNTGNATINNGGILTITNSTIAGNTSGSYGGGINTGSGSLLFLYNDTIYGNTSADGAGGVNGDVAAMANTIVAGNSSLSGQPDCLTPGQAGNSIVSLGYNLIQNATTCTITGVTTGDILGQSPMLATLASNGGPTQTMAPVPGSPAIGAGSPALPGQGNGACASIDQRGITRKASRICDIGAFQTGGPLAVTAISPPAVANSGSAVEVVSGNAFSASATVKLSRAGQPDIPGNPVTVDPGEAELATSFNLAGQAFGAWDVVVSNPDGSSATLPGGFLVQAPQAPVVTTDIIGPGVVRDNSKGTVNVVVNNRSNTDAYGVVVGIQVLDTFAVAPGFPMLTPPFQSGQVAQDWTQVPIVVDQSKPINFYPFFLPFVPAGYSGSLPFTITYPMVKGQGESGGIAPSFVIGETSTAPELNPTLNPAIASLLVTGAQIFAQEDGVTIAASAAPAMQAYLANQYNVAIQSAISSVVTSGSVRLPAYSLSQLQFDLAQYGVSQPGSVSAATLSRVAAQSRRDDTPSDAGCGGAGQSECAHLTPIGPTCSAAGGSSVEGGGFFGGGGCGGGGGAGGGGLFSGFFSFLNGLFRASLDPNSKVGPRGATASQYLSGTSSLDYIVGFSNEPTAGLPAQTVVATDQLDTTKVDPSTFSLGPITVAGLSVTPPPGTHQYSTTIDLRPATNLLVRADAGINGTGLITWTFTSLDPATLQLTANVLAGFLPPDTNPPNGEAQMLFTVKQRANLATGTAVQNQATVVFDTNAAMITPVWTNLIDATAPQSKILPLNANQTTVTFPVQWSGTDAGSGIASYSIFTSQNGGAYTPWLTQTALTSANFTGLPGQSYAFYSTAQDAVGNQEATHLTADTVTSVTVGTPRITATIADTGQSSGSFYVDLKVTESGTAAVTNVLLSQITAKTLTGTGAVTFNAALSGALPASVGSLAVGGSQTLRLFFTVPAGVTKFSLTENGTLQVPGGAAASFSASEVVIL